MKPKKLKRERGYTDKEYIKNLNRIINALVEAVEECVSFNQNLAIADRFSALIGTKRKK